MLDFQGRCNARLLKSLKCSTFETSKILKGLMVNAASFISLDYVIFRQEGYIGHF